MNNKEIELDYADGIWKRLLWMILFGFIYSVTEFVLFLVIVIQFCLVVITGHRNERLLELGVQLATFVYQIIQFFVFSTNKKPYPFAPWPDSKADNKLRL